MTSPAEILRQLAKAGYVDTYHCPCEAQGCYVEVYPGVFEVTYLHDDWCPVLAGREAG